jgi:iron complex outermembrane receptor protein
MTPKRIHGSGRAASPFRDGAVVALVLSCGLAFAAGPSATFHVDQHAQPMADALREIARLTGASVLFDATKVNGRTSKAVAGELTAAQAISKAVEGSDLLAVVMPDGSIVIRAGAPASTSAASTPSAPHASGPPGGGADHAGEDDAAAAHVARPGSAPHVQGPAGASEAVAPMLSSAIVTSLGKVEVTGSRLKRIDAEGPTPVNVYTRGDIERSGQPTLERFLSSLNEASISPGEGASAQTTGQGTVQLRGLPVGSTLVLLNGRRMQAVGSSSANFFNINLIPVAAIERVEIVPVGSSAVYGGDALAGVVNIILKKSIDGVAFDARVGSAKGTSDQAFSLATGSRGDAGSFLLLGSYSKTSPLTMSERGFFADADYRRFGGVDARSRSCSPGTVTSTTGAKLPGLTASFAAIPLNASGKALTTADFAATAGQANLCNALDNGNGSPLVHAAEDFALHASGERRLSEAWSVFGELSFTKDRQGAVMGGHLLSNVLVPATNPYNPFGTAVRVTERLGSDNVADTFFRSTHYSRALLGVRGEVAPGWDLEATISSTRDGGSRYLNSTANTAARTAALASTSQAAALNPFTTGVAASDAVLSAVWPNDVRVGHGGKDQAGAFVRGSALTLPSGNVDVIVGAEAAHDRFITQGTGGSSTAARSTSALYGESRLPLWRADAMSVGSFDAGAGREIAALTLAARHDHYSDFGSASTYQAGLEVRPVKTFLLRGSAATSFKPPTLLELNVDPLSYDASVFALTDPARGGEVVGGTVVRATNPNLRPETGRAFSLGAVWEPASALGTHFAATAWHVKIKDMIAIVWPQIVLDNEALFPGVITRGPSSGGLPGPVTQALWTEVNYGTLDTSGVDLEAAHSWKTDLGRWIGSASATRTTRYDVAISPDAPVEDRLGRRAVDFWSPKWKGRVSLTFDHADWSVSLTSRYLGAYRDIAPSEARLGNFWVQDLAASFDLKKLGMSLPTSKSATLRLTIANVANRLPTYASGSPYYDVTQADWRGRYASVRLSVNW